MKKIALIVLALWISNILYSQMVVVTGKVTGFHKYPLKNIVVTGKKSKSSVVTNDFGVFKIVCPPKETLIFESKSFQKVTRKIKDPKDSINVNLVFKNTKKNKEYAVAYGIMTEKDLTYAVTNLTNENNNFETYTDVYELIRGRFSGVQVIGKSIIIRGMTSINSGNEALLIVDGTEVSDLSFINPREIKSIDVLKDAATSIYGTKGANGVVVIETKK
jgi:TonB-dependent SusC/RagA subfamily outer membrane receptor